MTSFIEFVLLGLGAGGVYTLISLSVVVVYRGSGIINFASGGIALLGAALYYELGRYMPTGPAVALSVLLCALFGALIQVLVMRPMRNTAPLTKVVATLATMTILSSAGTLRYGISNLILVPSFLPNGAVQIGPVAVGKDRIICLAIGLVAVVGLHVLYRYTPFGRAATGVSENERAVAALGWSPGRIALVNWSVGSALAGLAGILFVPIVGFSVSSIVLIILPALSAALVGNFVSFPLAFCGAELVGVLQSLSTEYISSPGWTNAVPFLVIVVLLVVRGRALLLRGHILDKLPRIGAAEIRWPRLIGFVALVIISLSVFTGNWSQAVTTTAVYALICLSLVVVTGYAGQLSLAQYAFAGVGALTSTRLAQVFGVPFIVALPAGVAVAVATGLLVAIPAFRVRGANLAVVTLGLAQVITSVLLGNPAYTGGVDQGTVIKNPALFGWNISAATHPRAYALVALGLLCLCAFMVRNIRRGTTGRRLLAVRSNERAALSIGISVTGAKLYAFGTSAGLAAVAGVLLGFQYTNVDFTQFSVLASVQAVLYAVLGGIGFISGALQGGAIAPNGVIQQILDHWVNLNSARFGLIAAAVLIPTIIMNRDGIAAAMGDSWEQLRGWLGKRIPGRIPGLSARRRAPRPAAGLPRDAAPVAYRVAPKALQIRDLSVRYGGTAALSGLSLTVNPGEVVGLIGANGAGKTTCIDAASGMTAAESGEIWLGDTRIDGLTARKRARAGLVRSFQSLELFDDLTVSDNLRAATDSRDVWRYFQDLFWPKKPPLPDTIKAVISAFELEPWLDRMPDELPYAQRRLVGIARAVASGPSVLMLDEPASGLDAASTAELARVVRTLADEWGMAVLLVEHDVAMVLETSDRIYAIDFGSLIGTGRPDEIRRDEKVNSAYFGVDEGKAEYEPAGAGSVAMTATAGGPAAQNGSVNGSSAAPPPLLEARGLYSGYGAIPVIRDINIRVGRGEVVALLGANGAGKTTTLLTLAGVLSPSAGSVESQGTTLLRSSLDRRCRQGLGVVFEERGIIPSLSTADNLRLGRGGVDGAVALFPELEGLLSRRAGLLSGGEQQILTVARALAASPDIILVDELSLGLAPKVVERLLRGIRAAVDQNNLGVLLVEQRIHTALRFADRAAIIRRGEIVLQEEAEALRGNASRIAEHYFAAT